MRPRPLAVPGPSPRPSPCGRSLSDGFGSGNARVRLAQQGVRPRNGSAATMRGHVRGGCWVRDETGGSLQSVNRALTALELVADAGALGVSELGRQLGVHKATASRLAAVLAERGLLERDPLTARYRIGFGLVRLAGAAMSGLDLVRLARPILETLAERAREASNLGVRSGDDVVYVDQISGSRSIVTVSWVGRRTPMHATSNGKVLLA